MLHQPIKTDPDRGMEHASQPVSRALTGVADWLARRDALAASVTKAFEGAGRPLSYERARAVAGNIVEYGSDLERALMAARNDGSREVYDDTLTYGLILRGEL
jgi:hypothetical protein